MSTKERESEKSHGGSQAEGDFEVQFQKTDCGRGSVEITELKSSGAIQTSVSVQDSWPLVHAGLPASALAWDGTPGCAGIPATTPTQDTWPPPTSRTSRHHCWVDPIYQCGAPFRDIATIAIVL